MNVELAKLAPDSARDARAFLVVTRKSGYVVRVGIHSEYPLTTLDFQERQELVAFTGKVRPGGYDVSDDFGACYAKLLAWCRTHRPDLSSWLSPL